VLCPIGISLRKSAKQSSRTRYFFPRTSGKGMA
jgi:hypothetical protein